MAGPNWKDRDQYAYCANYALSELAWEFLRRNSDYQDAWSCYQRIGAELHTADETANFDWVSWRQRREVAFDKASRPWGLLRPCDPNLNAREAGPEWRASDLAASVSMFQEEYDPPPREQGKPGEAGEVIPVFLRFGPIDIRKPIEPQLRVMRTFAIRKQKELRRAHPELVRDPSRASGFEKRIRRNLLVYYLRAHDARTQRARFREIGALFNPEGNYPERAITGKRYYERGRLYVSGGYRLLLLKTGA